MTFEGIDEPQDIDPPTFERKMLMRRNGFVVVEWGGSEVE